jgi:hypothetical protein
VGFINIRNYWYWYNFNITAGSLNGILFNGSQPQAWLNFSFIDNSYNIASWLTVHGGIYLANAALTGTVRQVGFLTGFEIGVIPNTLAVQMDYISGHHALSGASANIVFNLTPLYQVYFGVLVPEQQSGNEFSGVLGFNLSTQPL